MSNVVDLFGGEIKPDDNGDYRISYLIDELDEVVGISHPDWPFSIQRVGDDDIALVGDKGDIFGALPADQFNVLLVMWLKHDDPGLLRMSFKK